MQLTLDLAIKSLIAVVLIVGGYQFYFIPQKRPLRKHIEFRESIIDKYIPFKPGWVWIYSGLYYPGILSLILLMDDFRQFCYVAFSFIILLIAQLVFFFLFPVKTPDSWRKYSRNSSISRRFLNMVHNYDSPLNCFPSMHTSVATLVGLHLYQNFQTEYGYIIFLFPLAIGISCLYTKQHYAIDVLAGTLLGVMVFNLFLIIEN